MDRRTFGMSFIAALSAAAATLSFGLAKIKLKPQVFTRYPWLEKLGVTPEDPILNVDKLHDYSVGRDDCATVSLIKPGGGRIKGVRQLDVLTGDIEQFAFDAYGQLYIETTKVDMSTIHLLFE